MKYIENLKDRDGLREFNFLLAVKRDSTGSMTDATRLTLYANTVKHAIKRLHAMAGSGDDGTPVEFILV